LSAKNSCRQRPGDFPQAAYGGCGSPRASPPATRGHTHTAHTSVVPGSALGGLVVQSNLGRTGALQPITEAGLYQPPGLTDKYPRLQILSIAELLAGKKIEYPRLLDVTFKKAPKARKAAEEQIPLGNAEIEDEGPF